MKVYELVQRLQEFDQQLDIIVSTFNTPETSYDVLFDISDIEEDDGRVIIEVE